VCSGRIFRLERNGIPRRKTKFRGVAFVKPEKTGREIGDYRVLAPKKRPFDLSPSLCPDTSWVYEDNE